MQHVFVETNWVVGYAAPAHDRIPEATTLLERARSGEVRLYLPAICISEARRALRNKYQQPNRITGGIRSFLKTNPNISKTEADTVRRIIDMFDAHFRKDLQSIDETLADLRTRKEIAFVSLDEAVLVRSIDLNSMLELEPFDQAILAAVLVQSQRLRAIGETDISFCNLDRDLQPWDKGGNSKGTLTSLYDDAHVWVYGDFELKWPAPYEGWPPG